MPALSREMSHKAAILMQNCAQYRVQGSICQQLVQCTKIYVHTISMI